MHADAEGAAINLEGAIKDQADQVLFQSAFVNVCRKIEHPALSKPG